MPRLTSAGVRLAVSGDIEELGVVQVVAKERGICQARRIILVLSPAYLDDNMADFENTLGQSIGVHAGTYRLLPVKIALFDPAKMPARLSMLTTLDLTDQRHEGHRFEQLVQALRGPLPRRN